MQAEQTLIRWAMHFGGIYVQQSGGLEVFRAMRGQFDDAEQRERILGMLKSHYGMYGNDADLQAILDRLGRLFFDVDDWKDAIGACDLSIGTRYHGNALAMQVSVPALVAVHDSRTEELCQSTMIPTVHASMITPRTELRDLLANVEFDATRYDARRRECASDVLSALVAAGIEPSPRLRQLAGPRLEQA